MTTFADLKHRQDYLKLPHIERREIRLLWHADFWDHPLNGMLLYKNVRYWFENCETAEKDQHIHYLIVELSPEQFEHEAFWHERFRQKVGTHTDYDKTGTRLLGTPKPKESWNEFYEPFRQRGYQRDFSNNTVIGWFELG